MYSPVIREMRCQFFFYKILPFLLVIRACEMTVPFDVCFFSFFFIFLVWEMSMSCDSFFAPLASVFVCVRNTRGRCRRRTVEGSDHSANASAIPLDTTFSDPDCTSPSDLPFLRFRPTIRDRGGTDLLLRFDSSLPFSSLLSHRQDLQFTSLSALPPRHSNFLRPRH